MTAPPQLPVSLIPMPPPPPPKRSSRGKSDEENESETPQAPQQAALKKQGMAESSKEPPPPDQGPEMQTVAEEEEPEQKGVVEEKGLDQEGVEEDIVVSLEWEKTKTLKELKQMCTDKNIPAHGKKSELISRLVAASRVQEGVKQ